MPPANYDGKSVQDAALQVGCGYAALKVMTARAAPLNDGCASAVPRGSDQMHGLRYYHGHLGLLSHPERDNLSAQQVTDIGVRVWLVARLV